jgi:hypothetical protein
MEISEYHKKYAALSDEEIERKIQIKKEELMDLRAEAQLETDSQECNVAVIGCGDRRLIKKHQELFSEFCGKPVTITTLDIVVDHLAGEENVIQHDCVEPLPGGPYDITFGHLMLRFVRGEQQWSVLKNTYDALKPGGLAIQVLDFLDFTTESPTLPNGLHSVQLRKFQDQMDAEGMPFVEVTAAKGLILALKKPLQ